MSEVTVTPISVIQDPTNPEPTGPVDISERDADWCMKRKQELLGNAASLSELTIPELEEFHALCTRLRQIEQPAGKPAASGRGKKGAPTLAAEVASDFV